MNGFAERRASESSDRSAGEKGLLTWEAATARLPLVRRIAADLVASEGRLGQLSAEKAKLDDFRHGLAWPARSRRYELQHEIVTTEADLLRYRGELEGLGVVLLDASTGLVGFPTIVNDCRAFFSWKPGEDSLACWNYLGDTTRHPVPESWTKWVREERPAKTRSRSHRK